MNKIERIINLINHNPEKVEFQDVIDTIDDSYNYMPTRFINGSEDGHIINEAGENEGSCKIFAFAKINNFNVEQTLNCFGRYYRDDVLNHPQNADHGNIRTFIKYGWDYIHFEKPALSKIDDQ